MPPSSDSLYETFTIKSIKLLEKVFHSVKSIKVPIQILNIVFIEDKHFSSRVAGSKWQKFEFKSVERSQTENTGTGDYIL